MEIRAPLPPVSQPVRASQAQSAEPGDRLTRDDPGPPAEGATLTGDIRFHKVTSKILGNTRDVWVYLPPSYFEDPKRRYPVLYTQDGQNMFDRATGFMGNEWGVDEAAEGLMRSGQMREAIIVAVSNSPERMDEYTPVKDPKHGGGKAAEYARFLIDEVKPMIDTRYRTLKGPETTGVMGSSLGGLVSLYLGWNHPGVFGLVGALSPSLWWAGRDLIRSVAETAKPPHPPKIWLDMGTDESQEDEDHNGVPDVLDDLRSMGGVLVQKGYRPGRDLFYVEVPGGQHNEASWAERVGLVLKSLYPPR